MTIAVDLGRKATQQTNSKLHEEKRLNDGSLEKSYTNCKNSNLNFNCAYMYVGFVKQMCKL